MVYRKDGLNTNRNINLSCYTTEDNPCWSWTSQAMIRQERKSVLEPRRPHRKLRVETGVDRLRLNKRRQIRFATWNVKSLYQPGKPENLIRKMTRIVIGVLGLRDIQWADPGKLTTKNGKTYGKGNKDPAHHYGVVIFLDKERNKSVISFILYSERIGMEK